MKRYNTPHRSRVVKTRMTEEEYAEFAQRLSAYNMSQAEFIRQAITGAAIRPIITVSPVNDELLAAVGKLTAEYGRIGGNLNQIARTLNEWHSPYPQLAGEVRAAQALDLYVSGSLNVFNHKTNVDIHNRLVAFDIKELGKQLKKLGMLIIQDQIWGRVTQNRSQGRATWYFADEFHLLLKEEQTAAYSAEIWKRFRKWGGVPTGATQNVKDLLSSPEIENILENSDFITLLNQASGDRKILSERLNLSADQQKYIDNSEPGEGLLIFENVVLPFSNPIPKNTQLYKIMTTRLSEVVEL